MLSLVPSCRYFLYSRPTDMRCGAYSLAGLVQNHMGHDPLGGDVFVFIGKRGNQIRLLQWEGDGYAMYAKRLESGTFERPKGAQARIGHRELMLILQGVKLETVRLRKRFSLPGKP
jgi:transposase